MGYDQWIQVDISKEGCDANTIKIALFLAFPEIVEHINDCDMGSLDEENTLHFEHGGTHLWDCHKLFEEFSVKEISEKLGCQISVYYEGEEKEDAESIEVVNGEIKSHRVLGWVDASLFGGLKWERTCWSRIFTSNRMSTSSP